MRSAPRRVASAALSGGAVLLLTLVIAFIASTGTFPTDGAVAFFAENWRLFPAHLLQTAPTLAILASIATLVLVVAVAVASYRTERHLRAWWAVYALALALGAVACIRVAFGGNEPTQPTGEQIPSTEAVTAYLAGLPARQDYAPSPGRPGTNVIVILAESLRHDLLTTHADAAPFLNQLAREGIVFDRAYATASHSNLTDLAFWYSQYPYRGRGFETYTAADPWRGTSMFDAFKASGYRTAYISSQNEKWGWMINWLKTPGVDYFFDSESFAGSTWENHDDEGGLALLIKRKVATAGKIEDSQTLAIARDWLEKAAPSGPVMLGMNLQNTHYSYVVPEGFEGPYQPSDLGFKAVYYTWPAEHKDRVMNRYLNAVLGMDAELQKFAQSLDAAGLWDDSLVVVLGDNGEGFHEHGFGNHSGPLYDEATRTLAVIKPPRNMQRPAMAVAHPISHIDIAATVLDMAGVALPGSFQGVPYEAASGRPAYMYANAFVRQFAVVQWPWKLMVTERPGRNLELYDLALDPAESNNLAAGNRQAVETLFSQYATWREAQFRYYKESLYRTKNPPDFLGEPAGSP